MQDGKFLSLIKQAGPVIRALRLTSSAAQVGAGATSVMIVAVVAYARWLEVLPPIWAKIATAAVVVLFLLVVEGGLKTFTPFGLDELLSFRLRHEEGRGKKLYRAAFMLVCLLLIGGLGLGTLGTSWIGRHDMAEVATPPPQTADLASITARQEHLISRMDSSFEAKLANLRETEAQRIKQAKAEAARLLENAKRSMGTRMYELYQDGNGWAEQQLSSSMRRAQVEGEQLIRDQVEAVERMEEEKRRYMTLQNAELRDRFESVEGQNQEKLQTWESKYDRNSALIGYFGIGCTLIFFVCQVLLSLARIVSDVPTFADEREADARAGSSPTLGLPSYSLREDLREAMGQLRQNRSPQPQASYHQAEDTRSEIGFDTATRRQQRDPQSGNNSPNTTGTTGNNSGNITATTVAPPPNNTGKKYRSDRRRQETLDQVRLAYQTLLAERNAPPQATEVARVVGRTEKTVRSALRELGLVY